MASGQVYTAVVAEYSTDLIFSYYSYRFICDIVLSMKTIPYDPIYKADFIRLNTAWIEKYFDHLEAPDHELFDNLESYLSTGTMIYFAVEDGKVAATCMVMPLNGNVWEIGKLAADETLLCRGGGSAVFHACKEHALSKGAEKIILITNHILLPAIHIYEKEGFVKSAQSINDFSRGDVQYEFHAAK